MYSIIKNYLFMAFFGALSILAMAFFVSALIYPTLPNISHLEKYRPKQPLQIFSKEEILIAEFGEERRDFIPISDTPQQMINAILSIEDRRFFEHPGIDLIGIFLFFPSTINIGKMKSFGVRLFSSINLLDQSLFRLRLSLKLGYFPVIMFKYI